MSHAPDVKPGGVPSLRQSYSRMQQAAGDNAPLLRRSLKLFALAGVFEGLAFACFYPLVASLLSDPMDTEAVWLWLAAIVTLSAIDSILRWRGNSFAYSDKLAKVNYALRLRLGEQLRRMPLEDLSKYRAGELGAILSGNVEETITPMSNLSAVILRTMVCQVWLCWRPLRLIGVLRWPWLF